MTHKCVITTEGVAKKCARGKEGGYNYCVLARPKLERGIILALLVLAGIYLIVVYLPNHIDTRILGFVVSGDDRFVVDTVYPGTPAATQGIRARDVLLAQDDVSAEQWRSWYEDDVETYLRKRAGFRDREVSVKLRRDAQPISLTLFPRALNLGEILTFFGIRTFLILFMLGLTIYILVSKTRDRAAFLISLCFCFTIFWLAYDEPFWPSLFSPLIRSVSFPAIYFVDVLEAVSLQLVVATLVHIALVFPQDHSLKRQYPFIIYAVYLFALLVPFVVFVFSTGGVLERINELYGTRLWLNSVFLIALTLLIFTGYRQCRTPVQREKVRWIFVSIAIVAVIHLTFWNVPFLVSGSPLVANYNWILLPVALLPLSMTLSITNHELFGIRGIIRGRILLLNTLLTREKELVVTRDQRIGELQDEIDQLRNSLEEYEAMERVTDTDTRGTVFTEKLEQRYPEIALIREERLLGDSPLWKSVFEHAILAAQGSAPALIVGESGTGKTDIAWTIYRLSDRRDQPFKEISCAQFEHADPAFALGRLFGIGSGHGLPNAPREGRAGLLEECDGGVLFLDDVDRLPLAVQDLLLYPLEGRAFEPGIGSGPARKVSVKFIFAMNRDPERMVAEGKMRGDVLARIRSRVEIPPLRQRPEDIPVLVDHFIDKVAAEIGHKISLVSPKSMHLLCSHTYSSGNARELRAEIEKAVGKAMLENDTVLRAGYLSEGLRTGDKGPSDSAVQRKSDASGKHPGQSLDNAELLAVLRKHDFQIKSAETELGYSHKSKTLSHHLRGMCIEAMRQSGWNIDDAANVLSGGDKPKVAAKLKAKMLRFLSNVEENVSAGTAAKLYQNLPAAYHDAMDRAIEHVRKPGRAGI